jgi:hypothetical protein
MLDVRSNIVLQVDQAVSAVEGKSITFTDNTAEGYQGETNKNSFTIDVTSDLVTIDNDKGLIIIDVDANFDLDLASNYTMSIDTGAFLNSASGQATSEFSDVSFNTVTPTSGENNVSGLGSVDLVASVTNYLPTWYTESSAGPSIKNLVDSGVFTVAQAIDSATPDYNNLSDTSEYEVQSTAAQSVAMSTTDGSLVDSAQWVDIEGLGVGTTSGNVASLAADIASGNVFKIDASSADYVFVFSDQNPAGGDSQVGAGLETNTDFSVFLDEFGAGDQVYVDDAFNDADNLNVLSYEVFASGNGSEGAELYLGLSGGDGDPRLYVGLEGDTESTDESGNADNSLEGVNGALGLDDDSSVVITA